MSRRRRRHRPGKTVSRGGYLLAEALVMLVLSLLISAIMCAALLSQARLARSISERVAHNDAARTAFHILPAELRTLSPERDVRAFGRDSVAARWIRASGVVCASSGEYTWVRLRGMRMPDPSKDSLLVSGASGEVIVPFDGSAPDPGRCPAASNEIVLRTRSVNGAVAGAVLVYESGTYYLTQRALRYRVGAEGRQPLTEEHLRDGGTGMYLRAASAAFPAILRVTLELRPAGQHQIGRIASMSIPFGNGSPP